MNFQHLILLHVWTCAKSSPWSKAKANAKRVALNEHGTAASGRSFRSFSVWELNLQLTGVPVI
jgi:hypothetical protein